MIRVSLYEKDPKRLKVKFEFNEMTLHKIKSIPGRSYNYNDKTWTIPYKYVNKLINMFDESEFIIESGVDLNYREFYTYDFTYELRWFKDKRFEEFIRYMISKSPYRSQVEINDTIKLVNMVKALAVFNELEDNKHDILLAAAFCSFTLKKEFQDTFEAEHESLDVNLQYIYNMYWKEIKSTLYSNSTKLSKLLKESIYLMSQDFIKINVREV